MILNNDKDISNRVILAIKESGLSAYRISKLSGLSQNTILNYMKGITVPDLKNIKLVSPILKVNETWIITGKGEMFLETYNQGSNLTEFSPNTEEQEPGYGKETFDLKKQIMYIRMLLTKEEENRALWKERALKAEEELKKLKEDCEGKKKRC